MAARVLEHLEIKMKNDLVKSDTATRKPLSNPRRDDGIDRQQLEHDVRAKLRIIFSSAKKQSREIEELYHVNAAQLWILAELYKRPGLRVSDVARIIHIHNSTASNLLDALQKRGFLSRERIDEDQRVVRLRLTPAGEQFVSNVPQTARAVVSDALGAVSLESLSALDEGLEEMVAHLKIKDTGMGLMPIAQI